MYWSLLPWYDEAITGERLRDAAAIYSRKPSPCFSGDDAAFT
jgi:hypothetical protein